MLDQLEAISERFNEVAQKMTMPEVVSDMATFKRLSKEYRDLEKIVLEFKKFKTILQNISEAKELIATEKDEEMREFAKAELEELLPKKDTLEANLKELLI